MPELSVFVPGCDHCTHSRVLLFQCPQSPYYASLQTEVRRRGRTRGSTSRMEGPGQETEMRWDEKFSLVTPKVSFLWSYAFLAGNQIKNMFKSLEFYNSHCVLADFQYKLPQCLHGLYRFWILCIVFPGRNGACVWPYSLTKWVSGMHELTENSPKPPGKYSKHSHQTPVKWCPLLVIADTQKCFWCSLSHTA